MTSSTRRVACRCRSIWWAHKMTLYVMQGYPASGKSTAAKKIDNAIIICRDEIRLMLHGTYWTGDQAKEREVDIAEGALVSAFTRKGMDVVVDATHIAPGSMVQWERVSQRFKTQVITVRLATPAEVCVQRDAQRAARGERAVGEEPIRKKAKQYPISQWPVAGRLLQASMEET